MEYRFRAKGLSVGYDDIPLIRDIELSVAPGEIVALIGPNGSGKSTILKSITRQLRSIAGAIYLCGRELREHSQRELARRLAVARGMPLRQLAEEVSRWSFAFARRA